VRGRAYHEEAEAQEGQVGRRFMKSGPETQTDFHEEEDPVDDKGAKLKHLGNGWRAREFPHLGWGLRISREQRHEGSSAATSRRSFVEGSTP
jgi:hypothetical protein